MSDKSVNYPLCKDCAHYKIVDPRKITAKPGYGGFSCLDELLRAQHICTKKAFLEPGEPDWVTGEHKMKTWGERRCYDERSEGASPDPHCGVYGSWFEAKPVKESISHLQPCKECH